MNIEQEIKDKIEELNGNLIQAKNCMNQATSKEELSHFRAECTLQRAQIHQLEWVLSLHKQETNESIDYWFERIDKLEKPTDR